MTKAQGKQRGHIEDATENDDWDALTPKQQKEQLARFRARQRQVQQRIKNQVAEMAAFVRANPSAVIEMTGDVAMRAGQISRYVFHIEVDADRFERFNAARNLKAPMASAMAAINLEAKGNA